MRSKLFLLIILFLSFTLFIVPVLATYVPHQGDNFSYYEVQSVDNGTGNYAGYTDQTIINGSETVNGINNGIVSVYYSWTSNWNDNQGDPSQNNASSGYFEFSSTSFLYTNGTDDQEGYVNPTVWFCIDPSASQRSTFELLNTVMTVISTNYNYHLPSQNINVQTIYAQGSSSFQRNDAYGQFNAAYTWNAYFDPSSGYIVGYNYVEQDTNSSGTGFTFTDNLYITSASYSLTTVPEHGLNVLFLAMVIIFIVAVIALYIILKRRHAERPSQEQTPVIKPKPPNAKCPYCGAPIRFEDWENTTECEYCGREIQKQNRL